MTLFATIQSLKHFNMLHLICVSKRQFRRDMEILKRKEEEEEEEKRNKHQIDIIWLNFREGC